MSLPASILEHVLREISGDGYEKVVMATPDRPDARFFVGVLRPAGIDPSDETGEDTEADPKIAIDPASPEDTMLEEEPVDPGERLRVALTKFSPSSVGIRFAVPKTLLGQKIRVEFRFAVLVPCQATWEDVKGNFAHAVAGRLFIPKVYRRLVVRGTAGGFTPTEAINDPQGASQRLSQSVANALREALKTLADGGQYPAFHRRGDDTLHEAPRDSAEWNVLWDSAIRTNGPCGMPDWRPRVEFETLPALEGAGRLLLVSLANETVPSDSLADPRDPCLYTPELQLEFDDVSAPAILSSCIGENCAVFSSSNKVRTDVLPREEQNRRAHRMAPGTSLQELEQTPIQACEDFVNYLRGESVDPMEFSRILSGSHLIETNEAVRKAFQLAIRSLRDSGHDPSADKKIERLFPFQLGFVLATLDELVRVQGSLEPNAHALWFPTGGGKTEAYFVLCLIAGFLDRLEGKQHGCSAWLMYPLRLLSFQQLERFVHLCYYADVLRASDLGDDKGDRFVVGMYVGSEQSPNRIGNAQLRNQAIQGHWNFVENCPRCGSQVVSGFDDESWRITHRCSSQNCVLATEGLPITVTDDEAYRFQPTFLLGTVDKITMLGINPRLMRLLLGSQRRCKEHGFAVDGNRRASGRTAQEPLLQCAGYLPPRSEDSERRLSKCRRRLEDVPCERGSHPPRLLILDEAHLLEEETGSFFSHYLAALRNSLSKHNARAPLMVAASATILNARSHLASLYSIKPDTVKVFPALDLDSPRNAYYANTDDRERLIVGLRPFGKTLIDSTIHLLAALRGATSSLPDDARTHFDMHTVYILAKREGDVVFGSAQGQLLEILESRGLSHLFDPRRMVSIRRETDRDEIREFYRAADSDNPSDRPQIVIATATIGHGVDIRNLNVLILMGLPRRFSEYIQVLGRAGRFHPALVLVVAHPLKDRDTRFHTFFHEFHRKPRVMLSEVPLNPIAPGLASYTVPGVMASALYSDLRYLNGWEIDYPENFRSLYGSPGLGMELVTKTETILNPVQKVQEDGTVFRVSADFLAKVRRTAKAVWSTAVETPIPQGWEDTWYAVGHQSLKSLRSSDNEVTVSLAPEYKALIPSGVTRITRSLVQSVMKYTPGALPFFGPGGVTVTSPRARNVRPNDTTQIPPDVRVAIAFRMHHEVDHDDLWRLDAQDDPAILGEQMRALEPQSFDVIPFPEYLVCRRGACRRVVSVRGAVDTGRRCPGCQNYSLTALRLVQVHGCGMILDVPRSVRRHIGEGHEVKFRVESERDPTSASWVCNCTGRSITRWPEDCPVCALEGQV